MTKSKVLDVSSYSFSGDDKLFFDTNVWLFIEGPFPDSEKKRKYSTVLNSILELKSSIFIDVLVLAEFINRCARWENKAICPDMEFKQFRNSEAFKSCARDITITCKRIIKRCKRCSSCFVDVDISLLLDQFGEGGYDFNDQIITEICRKKGFILVTDDSDFIDSDLTILTANPTLLQ